MEASHLKDNLTSGRALQKNGHVPIRAAKPITSPKWDVHCDKEEYAIDREDYLRLRAEKPETYRYERLVPSAWTIRGDIRLTSSPKHHR